MVWDNEGFSNFFFILIKIWLIDYVMCGYVGVLVFVKK